MKLDDCCSTVSSEHFQDISLETQDGKQVVMSDTDREALVMGMTLHDKAQQLLQKVRSSCMHEHISGLGTLICKCKHCAKPCRRRIPNDVTAVVFWRAAEASLAQMQDSYHCAAMGFADKVVVAPLLLWGVHGSE